MRSKNSIAKSGLTRFAAVLGLALFAFEAHASDGVIDINPDLSHPVWCIED